MKPVWGIVLGIWAATCGWAQVTLELSAEQKQFLPAERLAITVRIQNNSGQTLKLAARPDWLVFGVETSTGTVISKVREVPVAGEFDLDTAERARFVVDIAPYFELQHTGRYKVTAQLIVPVTSEVITSIPVVFDVIPGTKLWSEEFGIPPPPGKTNAVSERRKYLLQQASHLKQLRLYARVTDPSEGFTYSVFPLGTFVSFSNPQPVIDREGRLHVIHQWNTRAYTYHLVQPDGNVALRQTWEIQGTSRPILRMNDNGEVHVSGGKRKVTSADIPATEAPHARTESPKP